MEKLPKKADLVIVGAGVTGCAIAREASRYTKNVVVLEKECDVADGTSKANNAEVHSGIGEKFGTLKQKLNVRGNQLYDQFVEGLNIDFKRHGLLMIITPRTLPEDMTYRMPEPVKKHLFSKVVPRLIILNGKLKGIPGLKIVKREEVFRREPNVTREAVVGIHDPSYGLVCPYKLTIALAEHAVINGAKVFLNTPVTGVRVENGMVKGVETNRGFIETEIVVNAAGVFADEVAEMAGAGGFKIHPRKGATLLFDREATQEYVSGSVSEVRLFRKVKSKGGGAMPTLEGNLQLGPTAIEVEDKLDTSISAEEIAEIFERFYYLFPNFPRKEVISAFSGVRAPTYEEDFVIGASDAVHGFVNVAGIQSPGLASAPAISEMVIGILHDLGIPLKERDDFNPVRQKPKLFAEATREEQEKMVKSNPRHGHVVCRCEQVTEADVVNAIHGIIPATTTDGVKRRTRAGMGRCQGGFCGNRVSKILAAELGISPTEVTKDGEGSPMFVGSAKELLKG